MSAARQEFDVTSAIRTVQGAQKTILTARSRYRLLEQFSPRSSGTPDDNRWGDKGSSGGGPWHPYEPVFGARWLLAFRVLVLNLQHLRIDFLAGQARSVNVTPEVVATALARAKLLHQIAKVGLSRAFARRNLRSRGSRVRKRVLSMGNHATDTTYQPDRRRFRIMRVDRLALQIALMKLRRSFHVQVCRMMTNCL